MILALDIALKTGFAYGHTTTDLKFGEANFEGLSGLNARVGRRFHDWLRPLVQHLTPSLILIEQPFLLNQGPTRLLFGLVWEALRIAEDMDIPVIEESPGSIKKFITGNGRAKKPEVMEAVAKKGYKISTDNEADAVALLLFHLSKP